MLHGARTFVLQDEDGQTVESHSISAGLDYPGVGPQHAHLAETGRATYLPVTDAEAMDALALLARTEGIIPAIESAHASPARSTSPSELGRRGARRSCWSTSRGRGDKDMGTAIEWFGLGRAGRPRSTPVSTSRHRLREGPRARAAPPWSATCRPASPTSTAAIEALRAMVDAGCDVIEVGLPYSDPVMDGPTIQAAAQQALDGGVRTSDVLRTVEAVAATGTPTVVMTYWNPVERYGVDRFAADLAARRGSRADHARPDPRQRRGVDRRRRRARPRQDLPGRADLHRRADRDDDRRLPRLRLRHRRHGRHRRPRPRTSDLAGPLVARTKRDHRPARSASASASATATRRPRWRRTPTA